MAVQVFVGFTLPRFPKRLRPGEARKYGAQRLHNLLLARKDRDLMVQWVTNYGMVQSYMQ